MRKKGGRKRDMIGSSIRKSKQQRTVGIPTRGQKRPQAVRSDSDPTSKGRGGLPTPWGSGERVGESGANRIAAERFHQPITPNERSISQGGLPQPSFGDGQEHQDHEAVPTEYRPAVWPQAVGRRKYKRDIKESWQKSKMEPKTKIITLVRIPPKARSYGQLFGSHTTYWLLCCPACGVVGELDHQVTLLQDAITITPSVECPQCGFHETIMAWSLKRA